MNDDTSRPGPVEASVEGVARCRGLHPVRARWFHDRPSRHRDFLKLVRSACDANVSDEAFASMVLSQERRKTLPNRIVEGERQHPVGLIRRFGGIPGFRSVLRRLANGVPVSPNGPPPTKTREELEASWKDQPPYQGEWRREVPGCREALEFLRAAANNPHVSAWDFSGIVYQMQQAGTLPDRLVLPNGSGFDVSFVLRETTEEMLRGLLREKGSLN